MLLAAVTLALAVSASPMSSTSAGVASSAPAPATPAHQREAATRLIVIVEETFAEIARHLRDGVPYTEAEARDFAERGLARDGLVFEDAPVVAAGAHASDPLYSVSGETPIRRGDLIVLAIAARKDVPGAIFADVTWMAFAGRRGDIPKGAARAWPVVRDARDLTVATMRERAAKGFAVSGAELDTAARAVAKRARLDTNLLHATGHSLGEHDQGAGTDLKAGDMRPITPGSCVTIEPGLYQAGSWGVRSGIDVCLGANGAEITTGIAQREIRALLD
jgi:Xaa-Pro dipeptidase